MCWVVSREFFTFLDGRVKHVRSIGDGVGDLPVHSPVKSNRSM